MIVQGCREKFMHDKNKQVTKKNEEITSANVCHEQVVYSLARPDLNIVIYQPKEGGETRQLVSLSDSLYSLQKL